MMNRNGNEDINKVPLNGAIDEDAIEELTAPIDMAGYPGSEDLAVNFQQGQGNPLIWLVTGSDEAKEYLARGRKTAPEIADIKEMLADMNELETGDTDLMGLIEFDYNASIGQDGLAREEFIRASRGGLGMMGGMLGRAMGRMGRQYGNPQAS